MVDGGTEPLTADGRGGVIAAYRELAALGERGLSNAWRPVGDAEPRPRGERLLSRNLLPVYGIVSILQAAAGFFSYFVILYAGGWQWGADLAQDDPLYRSAVTGFFTSIIVCQIANVIICRTGRRSLFTVGFLSNRLVLLGVGT
ncbi:MAG: cation-translocating P-type ATPase C-terminal domain-containing protein [Alphaproteobacteria bacterium]